MRQNTKKQFKKIRNIITSFISNILFWKQIYPWIPTKLIRKKNSGCLDMSWYIRDYWHFISELNPKRDEGWRKIFVREILWKYSIQCSLCRRCFCTEHLIFPIWDQLLWVRVTLTRLTSCSSHHLIIVKKLLHVEALPAF